ncbi:hypothetical protein L798_04138 [Zootermopsis nevadensis]|uniref:Uncharacterized protein n=1 Tax=Zootermopsis nevadensis TaxID=136037 RepID=A0A067REG5_ZOONE|nr:hypothetical protein L798_04138 [Zootermopsis nevadensis]
MLDLEVTLRDVPRIAMRMAEIITTKTAKQFRDKRCQPTYKAKREERLREAFPADQGLAYESSMASPCEGTSLNDPPASDDEAALGGETGLEQLADESRDCTPPAVEQLGEDDWISPAVYQQVTNELRDDCTMSAVQQPIEESRDCPLLAAQQHKEEADRILSAAYHQPSHGLRDCIPPAVQQKSNDDCTPLAAHLAKVDDCGPSAAHPQAIRATIL